MAETEFPIPARKLRDRLVQLHHQIEQGVVPESDEDSILDLVFSEAELEWIEENHETLFAMLMRIADEYEAVREASDHLEVSEQAAAAFVRVLQLDAEADEEEPDEDEESDKEERD